MMRGWRWFGAILTLAAVYFVAGKLGLSLAFVHASATAVWPPSGIAIAALLLWGRRLWPGIFLGAFLVNATTAGSVATSLGIATGNTLEAVVARALLSRFANGPAAFEHAATIFKFVVLAGFLSTAVSATIGVTTISVGGFADWQAYGSIWLTWWLGDLVSALVVTPFLVTWKVSAFPRLTLKRGIEVLGLAAAIGFIGQTVFGGWWLSSAAHTPLSFLSLPPLLWAAFRLGQRGAATAVALMSLLALLGTLRGFGPFVAADSNTSLLLLQGFMGTIAVTVLVLAAAVAERKRAEEALQRSHDGLERQVQLRTAELLQAKKFELIGQMAAGIAHEINTPVQYVSSNVGFLQNIFGELNRLLSGYGRLLAAAKRGAVPPALVAEVEELTKNADLAYLQAEVPKAVAQSLEGVERVAKIVRSVRELSHPSARKKTPLDLNRALERSLTVAQNEWRFIAEVATEFDSTLPPVPCLEDELSQVFLNVILNAAHAVGEVVGDGSLGKGRITIRSRREGSWAEIRVSDTGPGIPPSIGAKIFEPFFTTKEVGKGTGQGLALARTIVVQQHGGTLTFETVEGRGTTFIIRLPLHAAAERAPAVIDS
ncbi:MAG: MASE1 domain-containing protein [Candidatus Omnitrophica bacterium]|nr:MASE1 domain-containing protein [Candidatus Omnitrophota bacterium]